MTLKGPRKRPKKSDAAIDRFAAMHGLDRAEVTLRTEPVKKWMRTPEQQFVAVVDHPREMTSAFGPTRAKAVENLLRDVDAEARLRYTRLQVIYEEG